MPRSMELDEAIVESLLRNPDALVSLSLIKGNDQYISVYNRAFVECGDSRCHSRVGNGL